MNNNIAIFNINVLRKVENNIASASVTYYHGVDIYSNILPYWDKIRMNVNDCFHEACHAIKKFYKLISGDSSNCKIWSTKVQEYEKRVLGRFTDGTPFRVKPNIRKKIDNLIRDKLKIPYASGVSRILPIFNNLKRMKSSELISYIGDYTVYILLFCELDEEYLDVFIRYIRALEPLVSKVTSLKALEENQIALDLALAELELKVPVSFNYITQHVLHHMMGKKGQQALVGGYIGNSMKWAEMWNKYIRYIAPKATNTHRAISDGYSYFERVSFWRAHQLMASDGNLSNTGRLVNWNDSNLLEMPGMFSVNKDDICYNIERSKDSMLCDNDMLYIHPYWAQFDADYRLLLEKYNLYKQRNSNRVNCTLHEYGKLRNIQLPAAQLRICEFQNNNVKYLSRVTYNNVIFRPYSPEVEYVSDNTFIKVVSIESENNEKDVYYGRILSIFVHNMINVADSPNLVFLRVHWYQTIGEHKTLTIVRDNPDYVLNEHYPFEILSNIIPQNISLWPRCPFDENSEFSNDYFVIDKKNQYCFEL